MLQLADSRVLHSGQMPLTCASCMRSEVPEEAPSLAGLVIERVEPLRPRRAFMAPDTEKASEAVSPRTRIRQTPKDTFEVICGRAGSADVSVDGRNDSHGREMWLPRKNNPDSTDRGGGIRQISCGQGRRACILRCVVHRSGEMSTGARQHEGQQHSSYT